MRGWSAEQAECHEQGNQRDGDGRHDLDEDVERDADDVFASVADSITSDDDFVDSLVGLFVDKFRNAFEQALLDVLLGIVECATRVSKEDGEADGDECCASKRTTDEVYPEDKSGDGWND